jgi:hypothetical protein
MNSEGAETYEGYSILELMGHRRLGGYVREQTIAGTGFLRIDIPGEGDEPPITQFYSPTSVYGLTPVTEEMAKAVARRNRPQPVARLELALPAAPVPSTPSDAYRLDDVDDVGDASAIDRHESEEF